MKIMFTAFLAISALSVYASPNAASVVKLEGSGTNRTLTVNGQPYFIKGAGGGAENPDAMKRLAAAGGNSTRTWGAGPETAKILDTAQRHGISVTVGHWLGHVSHGFDWKNKEQLDRQFEAVRQMVRTYRDHPALLMWALGNEMELHGNNNETLWQEIGRLAKMVKQEDPNHPVTTVVAETDQAKIDLIKKFAPELDLLGVNSYGGLSTLPDRLKQFGWTKPFIVTEFGPLGQWEVGKSPWGVSLEPTSTEKAKMYRDNYERRITANKGWCLGSYAFIWGDKQEETATWFGMLLPTGEVLQSAEEMSMLWSGKVPSNRAPRIESADLKPGWEAAARSKLTMDIKASDPDSDLLEYEFILRLESKDKKPGGYPESAPAQLWAKKVTSSSYTFDAPEFPGQYRMFCYIRDRKGNAATANIPLLVK